jgi:hypothetical protein
MLALVRNYCLNESLDMTFYICAGIVSQMTGLIFKVNPVSRGYGQETPAHIKCFRLLLRDLAVMIIGPYMRSQLASHVSESMVPFISAFIDTISGLCCQYLEIDPAYFLLPLDTILQRP